MNNHSINHTIIEFLTELTDNNTITIQQNKHIKLVGLYGEKNEPLCFRVLLQVFTQNICVLV